MRDLVPKAHDIIRGDKKVGKRYAIKDAIITQCKAIFEHFYAYEPSLLPDTVTYVGGMGSDGFSSTTERMFADKDLNSSHRNLATLKCSRIMCYDQKNSNEPIEIFLEESQGAYSSLPVAVIAGKEDFSLTQDLWLSLLEELSQLKEFDVPFHGRNIKVKFPNPRFIGDGKACLNMLNLSGAYCYMCDCNEDDGQSVRLVKAGMKINRSVKSLFKLHTKLMKTYNHKKANNSFIKQFTSARRKGLCGKPIVNDEFTCNPMNNLPTAHLHSHIFSLIKDIFYQMRSRNRTQSSLSVNEEQMNKGKQRNRTKKITLQLTCEATQCNQVYLGYQKLLLHVNKSKKCLRYYKTKRMLETLTDQSKKEKKAQKLAKPKNDHDTILSQCKDLFTFMVKQEFGIAVNQVKVAGHGATVENFNTCRIFLDPSNRDRVIDLFMVDEEDERKLRRFLKEAHVILSVTNSIGKVNVPEFRDFVRNAYIHWIQDFGKLRKLKKSIHWTLGKMKALLFY